MFMFRVVSSSFSYFARIEKLQIEKVATLQLVWEIFFLFFVEESEESHCLTVSRLLLVQL